MRRLLVWLPFLLFAAVVVVVATGLLEPADKTVRSAMIGKLAPAFALPPIVSGKPGLSAADLRGGPRLVNIFASWCVPCIAEAPQLLKLERAGVTIDGVAVRDTPEALRAFLARNGDPYARIGGDPTSRVQLAFGSSGVPETFVVDGRGVVTYQHVGYIRPDDVPLILSELERAR